MEYFSKELMASFKNSSTKPSLIMVNFKFNIDNLFAYSDKLDQIYQ